MRRQVSWYCQTFVGSRINSNQSNGGGINSDNDVNGFDNSDEGLLSSATSVLSNRGDYQQCGSWQPVNGFSGIIHNEAF